MFADKADKHVATTCQDLHSTQLVTHDLYTHTSRQIINTGIMPEDNAVLITAGPYQFLAKFEGEAPKTVATFRKLLPYRQKIIHVDADFKLEFENHTAHPAAGQILFYPGGFSETELLFCYGNVAFASKMGALAANHFLTITEGQENLKALGKLVLYKGAKDVLFEVADQVKYAHI
jgi:hypothetical protein